MADFTALKTAIQNTIKQNGNEEITGAILQEVMLAVVSTLGDGAINDLVTALSTEVTNRQNADGTLQTNINNEATTRGNADTALGTRIDNEATARENADTALSDRITAITDAIDNGYVYAGIATTSTEPATGKVFYLTTATGVFTNFGGITVNTKGIKILKKVGSTWTSDTVIVMDDTPTENSTNLVKSGGVYELGQDITNPIYDNSILRGAQITDGGYIDPSNGQLVESAGWCYTDYIAIKPNTDYGPIVFCSWYNENKVYISGVTDANAGTHTSPSNAKYARFSIQLTVKESWAIAKGGVIVDGWEKKIFTKNLIKNTIVTNGGFIEPSNGQVVENAGWCYTDFIPITRLKYYGKLNLAAWYNYNKTYIAAAAQSAEGIISQAPSNAAYLRASIGISKRDTWSITENGEDDTLEGEILENKTRINGLEQTTDLSLVPNYTQSLQWYYGGGISPVNGNIITGGDYAHWYYIKDYIPIKPNTVYGNVSIGAFYDKYRNFISGFQQAIGTVTSPANAAFVRFCFGHPESLKFWEGTAPDFDNISDIRKLIAEIPIAENLDFHVGAGYDYTTFSSAVTAAKSVTSGVPTIHVHSGTYNLITENQAAANAGHILVMLDKSVNIIFDKDAKLTANFDSSYQYYRECSPIFIMGNANVCIEGMNIECSNSLYCIHDESYGNYVYTHKFINCVMSMTQEHNDGTVQCIGGGLGRFCRIEIVGGSYNSTTPGWDLDDAKKVAVSYHNGVNNSDNQNVIYVKDVYLVGKCRFNFSHCGNTQLMTNVYVSNCSVGAATTIGRSGSYYVYDNIQLFEWNMVVRD